MRQSGGDGERAINIVCSFAVRRKVTGCEGGIDEALD